VICERAWNWKRSCFTSTFDGAAVDASLLLLAEVGFLDAADPRFSTTVAAIEHDLRRGLHFPLRRCRRLRRAGERLPRLQLLVCQCALAALERRDEARALFEKLLACATATACWPSTSIRAAANSGAISSRPTAWSA
jgi:GH15 family glucan-1,4-alpha-glucosidase